MSISDYLEDGADYIDDDCDGDCDACNCETCDEHPVQKRYHRFSHLQDIVVRDYSMNL